MLQSADKYCHQVFLHRCCISLSEPVFDIIKRKDIHRFWKARQAQRLANSTWQELHWGRTAVQRTQRSWYAAAHPPNHITWRRIATEMKLDVRQYLQKIVCQSLTKWCMSARTQCSRFLFDIFKRCTGERECIIHHVSCINESRHEWDCKNLKCFWRKSSACNPRDWWVFNVWAKTQV